MTTARIAVPYEAVAAFCRRWGITELALFGSVLRDDFRPESDVDVLVTFAPDAPWSLHLWMSMREELERLLGRSVDLVEKAAVEQDTNPFRKRHILVHSEPLYVA